MQPNSSAWRRARFYRHSWNRVRSVEAVYLSSSARRLHAKTSPSFPPSFETGWTHDLGTTPLAASAKRALSDAHSQSLRHEFRNRSCITELLENIQANGLRRRRTFPSSLPRQLWVSRIDRRKHDQQNAYASLAPRCHVQGGQMQSYQHPKRERVYKYFGGLRAT